MNSVIRTSTIKQIPPFRLVLFIFTPITASLRASARSRFADTITEAHNFSVIRRKLLEPFVLSARFKRDVRIQIAGIYRRHRCVFTSPHVLNIEISYTDASIRLVL